MSYWTGVSGMISATFSFNGVAKGVDEGVLFQIASKQTKNAMGATLAVVSGEGLENLRRQFGSDRVIDYVMDLKKIVHNDHDSYEKMREIHNKFLACDNKVPYGSESSIQYSVTLGECYWYGDYDESGLRSGEVNLVIPFWGNLRDFEPARKPELIDWFHKVISALDTDWINDDNGLSHFTTANGHMVISGNEGEPTLHTA